MIQDIENITHKILARGHISYESKAAFIASANKDFGTEAKKKGEIISVPISVPKTVQDVVASNVAPALVDSPTNSVAIKLDQWKESTFTVTDDELAKINKTEHFLPFEISESIEALAKETNSFMAGMYSEFYQYAGAAGTTPFDTDASVLIEARKKLNQQNVPDSQRVFIMDVEAEARALALSQFADTSKSSDSGIILDGALGVKYGFNNIWENQVKTHVTAASGTPLINGSPLAGVTVLPVDGLTAAPAKGDLFTIAGNTQSYTVLEATALSGTESTLTISPALATDAADNAVLSFVGDHVANMAFHRDALTFAQRALETGSNAPATIVTNNNPRTGTSLRLEVSRLHKADSWSFDMLYGGKVTRPEGGVRVLG